MAVWNGITYTEHFGESGGDGWELAFANDASGATRNFDIPIQLVNDANFPNFGPQYMTAVIQAVQAFVGYPQVTAVSGAPSVRGGWYDVPVAQLNRGKLDGSGSGRLPMPFPNLWRLLYGVSYPPQSSNQQQSFLYCTRVPRIRGVGPNAPYYAPGDLVHPAGHTLKSFNPDGNDVSVHQIARMQCQYESLPYYVLPDDDMTVQRTITGVGGGGGGGGTTVTFADESGLVRFVEKLPKPSADYFTVQNGIMLFAEGAAQGLPVPFTVGKIISNINVMLRWHMVPEEAIASQAINPALDPTKFETAIDYALGRVNNSPFPNTGIGYPSGTMLLLAVSMVPFNAASGRRLYTVDFMFKFFAPGHHKIYSFKDSNSNNDFVEISSDGVAYGSSGYADGKHIYNRILMDQIFWPPKVPAVGT